LPAGWLLAEFREHDFLIQKSLLLEPGLAEAPWKTRRLLRGRGAKRSEYWVFVRDGRDVIQGCDANRGAQLSRSLPRQTLCNQNFQRANPFGISGVMTLSDSRRRFH
jgi:hypothetical protein